jgi:hypothetical protein
MDFLIDSDNVGSNLDPDILPVGLGILAGTSQRHPQSWLLILQSQIESKLICCGITFIKFNDVQPTVTIPDLHKGLDLS